MVRTTRRIISGIAAFVMATTPFAGVKGGASLSGPTEGVKEIVVSQESNFKTIESARDFIRTLDKSKYEGITVKIAAGEYVVTEPIAFGEKDSGTETCTVVYEGEEGTEVIGGVALTAKDFTKSSGGLTEYFPEEVRDEIVMVDLKDYGFTAEMIEKAMESRGYLSSIPFLSANGTRQMLAQYPNDWLHVDHTVTNSADGTTNTAIDGVTTQTVEYGDAHEAFVQSWSEVLPVYVRARLMKLWCPDDSVVTKIYKDCDKIDILFNGGHEPDDGTILYFYNVPEALDIPGEYIIDKNAILYYYPTEEFDTAILTLPLSDGLVTLEGADYITFKNIDFSSSYGEGLHLTGNHLSVIGCSVSSIRSTGVRLVGEANLFEDNVVHDIGDDAVVVRSGDIATMKGEGALIIDNDVYDCSATSAYGYCITVSGVNITVSHNDAHDSNFKGIHVASSVNTVVEYNEVWNMLLLCDDVGAVSGDGKYNYNVVFRYNYVHDIGPVGEAAKIKDYNPDYSYYGAYAFYFDGACSYMEIYDNIIYGCDTGYLSNGGRGNLCHNNVFIDCHDWYVTFSQYDYSAARDEDGNIHGSTHFDSFIYSSLWKKCNPDLASLLTTTEGNDTTDSRIYLIPAECAAYDNFIVYNKADRNFTNWGIRPYNIEEKVGEYASDKMNIDESALYTYTSKRETLDLEKIINEVAKDYIRIDYATFLTIGKTSD